MVGFVVNIGALLTWYDRRGGAMMQDRIGPNRAGIKISASSSSASPGSSTPRPTA